jgi:anti-sigma28 factor (negative regulator of flagellin synthesis)
MEYIELKNPGEKPDESKLKNDSKHPRETRMKSSPRPRSLTTLKLEIISERARKMQRMKEALDSGNYRVISVHVAKSLMKHFDEEDLK